MSSPSPKTVRPGANRRGRPAAGTEHERRERVLDAALTQLVETGADQLTMAAVAGRAGASKETLYRWFGDREGLFAALIQRNADRSAAEVEHALTAAGEKPTPNEFRTTLASYAVGLLSLLTGESSVALNRSAMNDPALRDLVLGQGRRRVGPIVERYLAYAEQVGLLNLDAMGGPAPAFELLYGLVVRDTQIRVLLGEQPPSATAIAARADEAAAQFLQLCGGAEADHK